MDRNDVILGDVHEPFSSARGKKLALEYIGDVRPRRVIQIGDLYDQLATSRHPHSRNVMTPEEELNKARANALELWKQVRRRAPKAECFQIMGNHDGRTMKRVLETLPEVEHLVRPAIRELYTFEGVKTIHSEWDELFLDDVVFMHGFKKFGEHVRWNGYSTVHGHDHRGDIKWIPVKNGNLFEMSVGFLGEIDSPAFGYRSQKAIHGWSLGIGHIDKYGPRFVAF